MLTKSQKKYNCNFPLVLFLLLIPKYICNMLVRMELKEIYKKDADYKPFLTSLLLIGLSYGLYKGILDNYLAEIVKMREFDRGIAEFFRELPGFFLILILALFSSFSSERLFKLGGAIMIFGLAMMTGLQASTVLAITSLTIYSLGEHIQLGMKSSLSLQYAQKGCGGTSLGIQSALSNLGNIFGYVVVMLIFSFFSGERTFRLVFFASLVILSVGMLFSLRMKENGHHKRDISRFYFRKKYKKYYMLEVFYGARKQIFLTFGPYVLILFYGANASEISMLFAISAIACFFASPVVGRIIDRLGYKVVMISDTLILVIVCFFYGFAHHIFSMHTAFMICSVNYILDAVISLASMASSVYVQDISDSPEEVKATINTGISVNHFISILIALFGGWIWQNIGIELLFTLSAFLGIMNSIYAATIKKNPGR